MVLQQVCYFHPLGLSGPRVHLIDHRFDKEGFSIWRVDFKYNSELTQVFMSSNQIGGFFNRLEGSRKYLFGSVGVLGTSNDSIITGVLILRGQDHKSVVDVAPDWESYEYRRIDLGSESDKKFFEGALAWDLEESGKKWADGKNVSTLFNVHVSKQTSDVNYEIFITVQVRCIRPPCRFTIQQFNLVI